MDEGASLPAEIVEALARGATILTGNQRAARTLRHQFDLRNRALGLATWEPPAILAWEAWTVALWQRLIVDGRTTQLLLNRAQEHIVWRAIVAADTEWSSMRTADSLAEMAADAWSRLCAHRGERQLRNAGVSADTRAFQRWAAAFERRCRAEAFLSPAQLEAALEQEIAAGNAALADAGYVLLGFDGMTPAQQALLEAMRQHGSPVAVCALTVSPLSRMLVASPDEHEELTTAARWMRKRLEEHPSARLALIVPGLEDQRAEVDRVLRHILAPELEDIAPQQPQPGAPFEFSLGVPLARTPMVTIALDLIRWAIEPLPVERVSHLLLSPYFAGGVEVNARAAFDAYELRRVRMLRPEITLDKMIRVAEAAKRSRQLPRLLGALKAMRRAITAESFSSETRAYADWADAMRTILQAAEWTSASDSIEFQTHRKWETVLDELATLDFDGLRVGFSDALATLNRLAQQALFAPESRNASVQVMGPLESAGSLWPGEWDAVWFLRAGDLTWPMQSGSSPLLSWHLQRELKMPGTNPVDDAHQARRITERIGDSAATLIFSYARLTTEGTQRPSTTLAGLSLHTVAADDLLPPLAPVEVVALETLDDSAALPPLPDRILRGGANLLKLQAACGFRAFAEQRLWATKLDAAEAGMNARERGSTVHRALEYFWKEVETQAALKRLSTPERHAILLRSIDTALEDTDALSSSAWDAAYVEVQRERLLALLDPWLLAEMERLIPFRVKLSERELDDVRIGPLRLKLRVDRIDETEFGDVILDYKTGGAEPNDWLSERPDEPQLPLYAVLSDATQLAGVAFAKVRAGKDRMLQGYETQKGILLTSADLRDAATLEDQVEEWQRILSALAEEFHSGDVRVRPKSFPRTCEYCAQRLLCRLDISLLEDGENDEEAAAEMDKHHG